MDFAFSEEQEMLRTSARDFLEKECPPTLVKEMVEDERGYPPELWHKMAELGWIGLAFPVEYGGGGMTFFDLMILLEEMGRARLPGPFFSTLVGGFIILEAGNESQRKELLPQITRGEKILTLALTEPEATYVPSGVMTKAVADGSDYIIEGTKLFIPDAHVADYLVCVTRTGDKEDGITLFLVDAKSPGINYTQLKTMGGDKQSEVTFNKVKVPGKNMIGELHRGWTVIEKILPKAAMGKCAEMVGGAQWVLDTAVAYAKERAQFG